MLHHTSQLFAKFELGRNAALLQGVDAWYQAEIALAYFIPLLICAVE